MVIMRNLFRHTGNPARQTLMLVLCAVTVFSTVVSAQDVVLEGNRSIPAAEIRQWISAIDNPDELADKIQHNYRRRGFYDAVVRLEQTGEDSLVSWAVVISEGPEIRFGVIQIEWVGCDPPPQKARYPGKVFGGAASETAVHKGLKSLVQRLRDDGYHYAQVVPGDFRRHGDKLDFVLRVIGGPRLRVTEWQVSGTQRTPPEFILKRLRLETGIPWTRDLQEQLEQHVHSWQFVRLAGSPKIVRVIDDSLVVINIPLNESPVFIADGGLGFDGSGAASQGLQGNMNLRVDNPFGRGRQFDLRVSRQAQQTSETRLQLTDPGLITPGIGTRVLLDQRRHGESYEKLSLGTGLSLDFSSTDQGNIEFTWNRILPLQADSPVQNARQYDLSASMSKTFTPNSSIRTDIQAQVTGSIRRVYEAEMSANALKPRFRLAGSLEHRGMVSAWCDLRLAGRGEGWLGRAAGNRWGDEMYLGGPESVRGYPEFAIPTGAYALVSGETGAHLTRNTRLHAVVDYARYQPFHQAKSLARWENLWSVGVGAEARSRLGRTRLDIGWPLPGAFGDGILYLRWLRGW